MLFGKKRIEYADDDKDTIGKLLTLRTPPLLGGLILGIGVSLIASRFEEVLSRDIRLVFFMPFIVYMAAAVGSQTQSIYVRDLKTGKAKFKTYLIKETVLGLLFGVLFGVVAWVVVLIWFKSGALSLAVGTSMFATVSTAPLVALLVTELLQLEHRDPALGAGPIDTVIQDAISIVLFGLISSAVILAQ